MPVIFEKQIDPAKKLGVWHITEPDHELFEFNGYSPDPSYSLKRNRELAVSRILLNYLLGYDAHIHLTKDKFGKPFMNNSVMAVSFSHSQDMVACMLDSEGVPVGVDIEKKRDRIRLLADKFCNKADITGFEEILHFHVVWGGKEVLYKIYGQKELDFREHLNVCFSKEIGTGKISKNSTHQTCVLGLEFINDFVLVWGF